MDLTTTTCTHRTTECPDEWVVCEERPVCVPVWQRCETTASEWRSSDGALWAICHDDMGPLWRSREQCEEGAMWL